MILSFNTKLEHKKINLNKYANLIMNRKIIIFRALKFDLI